MIEEFVKNSISLLISNKTVAESLSFFLYDSVKILLLLFGMITLIGILKSYIPQEKIRRILSGKKQGIGNFFAAIFGAVTPFCSCSSIPFFIGFLRAGIPLGVSLSFLITSPIVNEYAFVIMLGLFGWKVAFLYASIGIVIGFVGGIILGKFKLEKHLYIKKDAKLKKDKFKDKKMNLSERIKFGFVDARCIIKNMWIAILIGVGVGAIIHGFIPQETLYNYVQKLGIWGVPLAVLIGIPLYANCAAIIPVAYALFAKGVPIGTALAFMMATAALSLPEFIILSKVMKRKLIFLFFGLVGIFIIVIGYLLNFFSGFVI